MKCAAAGADVAYNSCDTSGREPVAVAVGLDCEMHNVRYSTDTTAHA